MDGLKLERVKNQDLVWILEFVNFSALEIPRRLGLELVLQNGVRKKGRERRTERGKKRRRKETS